jgi:hypothetical protein
MAGAARRLTAAVVLAAHAVATVGPTSPALAQTTPVTPAAQTPQTKTGAATTRGEAPPPPPFVSPVEAARGVAYLTASLANQSQPLRSGLVWRVYKERAEDDGSRPLVAESAEAAPALPLADGVYVVHVAYGLASATKRLTIAGQPATERLQLNAGGLRVTAMLADKPIARNRISISVFVPDKGNSEAKLVVSGAQPGDVLRLPEGNYHIVSTYLDALPPSALANKTSEAPIERPPTNSVVTADLRVPAGKLIDASLKHRAATMTLKLVNAPGGEALPNTVFTVLTPGGDTVRELRGAFPSLVLAEGEYVAIARNNEKTYQTTFRVTPALDRDVEIVAQ